MDVGYVQTTVVPEGYHNTLAESQSHDIGCERHLRELLRFVTEGWIAHEKRTRATAERPDADKHAKYDALRAKRVVQKLREACNSGGLISGAAWGSDDL